MAARRVLITALAAGMLANGVLLADALLWGLVVPVTVAEPAPAEEKEKKKEESEEPKHPALQGEQVARATYRRLIDEVSAFKQDLEARAERLAERERELKVVQEELRAERAELEKLRAKVREESLKVEGKGAPSFDRLLKAYEGMEPENAAAALSELYRADRDVVVDVLLGLRSRQAALVLDAVAARHAKIAADLSLEIWQKDPRRRN